MRCVPEICYLLLAVTAFAAETRDAEPRSVPGVPSIDSRTLSLRGDSFFRNADFEQASRLYDEAATLDPTNARAHWGLGRLARIQFRRRAARDYFETAFCLDARDPDILLSYSEYASDSGIHTALRSALHSLPRPKDVRILQVLARLNIAEVAASRPMNRLAGPYGTYRLKLSPFLPVDSTSYGNVLKVSLNESKPLRLVVDSGAKGLIISGKSARGLGLEVIAESEVGGLGNSAAKPGRLAIARSLAIDDFRLENCLVEVTDGSIVSGADGVIGTDVFQEFLLRLDSWSHVLDLTPFPDHTPSTQSDLDPWLNLDSSRDTQSPALHVGHLLAVRTAVGDKGYGLFVVDTGSAYNSVSPELIGIGRQTDATLAWRGAQGEMRVLPASSPVRLRMSGGLALIDGNVIAIDLTGMSQKEGTRISGLLGYSTLSKWTVTLNYRDGLVQLAPHEHSSTRSDRLRSEVEPQR